jgi:hypothetical protein
MVVDSSGNVGIGNTTPRGRLSVGADLNNGATDASTGINLKQTSTTAATGIYLERSGERKGYYIYLGSGNDGLGFQRNNAGTKSDVMTLDRDGNVLVGTTSANGGLFTVNGDMGPATDNARTCANAFYRWSVVYAATGTINTSDAREKTPVRLLNEAEIAAAQQIASEIGAYKWLSAVAEKGDAAREHLGMTVQRAIEIMEANGLVPFNYGFICYDENEETSRYSFRMDELAMFIARGQQAIINAQQAALESLTARMVALEGQP